MGNSDSKPKMEDNTDTDEEYLSMMSILGKKPTTTKDVPGTSRPSKKLKSDNRQEDNIAMATPSSSKSFQKATIPIPTLIDLSSDEFDSINDPSVSWETQTYVPNNVTEYVKQLQEMFPKTPVKYFEEEAKKIIGMKIEYYKLKRNYNPVFSFFKFCFHLQVISKQWKISSRNILDVAAFLLHLGKLCHMFLILQFMKASMNLFNLMKLRNPFKIV